MAFVNLQDVTYKYPLTDSPALQKINLQVNEGEFLAVIGPNGAGKSTLCYTLAGFVPHFFKGEITGTVEVAGQESSKSNLHEWVLNVGLAFQNPFSQISGAKYTVFEEIAFGLENIGIPRNEMKTRVEDALKLTGISDLSDRSPYSLSGGQQQRVALSSILVMHPKVLVLDEPTSQMDPVGTREVFGVIRTLAENGMTVILAEHKVEWIAQFADRALRKALAGDGQQHGLFPMQVPAVALEKAAQHVAERVGVPHRRAAGQGAERLDDLGLAVGPEDLEIDRLRVAEPEENR